MFSLSHHDFNHEGLPGYILPLLHFLLHLPNLLFSRYEIRPVLQIHSLYIRPMLNDSRLHHCSSMHRENILNEIVSNGCWIVMVHELSISLDMLKIDYLHEINSILNGNEQLITEYDYHDMWYSLVWMAHEVSLSHCIHPALLLMQIRHDGLSAHTFGEW